MPRPHSVGEVLVDARRLGVERDGRWIVRDVSLTIRRGEIVTLIGPNGSGKSTTAKVILGIVRPSSGQIFRKPDLVSGYVPQKLTVDATLPLTVARLMTLTGPIPAPEIDAALEAVQITHLKHAEVQVLSGGEFQRVLLARAIVRQPDLLVLDEPVQGVDFNGEVALYEFLRSVRDLTGCGILLISHDLHIVMAETDTVVCLNGHVCCAGSPQSVAASPEYLRLFGRRAAETLAVYRHHHDHTHLPDGSIRHADGTISPAADEDAHEAAHHVG